MKRMWTPIMVAVMALVLAGCSTGPGDTENSGPSVSPPLGQQESTTPSTPSPSASARESNPTSQTLGVDTNAAVIGQWGGATEGSPVLWFTSEGRFNGNDGCNTLMGQWSELGDVVELKNSGMTMMACPGTDTWLSAAASVQIAADTLHVKGADGAEIGTLPRINVAD